MFRFGISAQRLDPTEEDFADSISSPEPSSGTPEYQIPVINSPPESRTPTPVREVSSSHVHSSNAPSSRSTVPTESGAGIGFSDENLLGVGKREMLNLIDSLHSLGISSDISLPQIVIVGAQSTGKSSLIEGISGIKLPRASGTCTRCPTEIRLKHAAHGPWRCHVKLRFAHDSDGEDAGQAKTVPFGDEITDPQEVEWRLKKAQLAILNYPHPPEDFLYNNHDGPSAKTFSKDFITVEVYGPNVPDLSFYDLPGWIASAKDGNQDDVELVNDLIESYIKKPNCLILLTVACESDFETQGAYNLVRKFDPSGERTIGVLTKPDRIAAGDEDKWIRLVMNEEIIIDRGWFCVKQPDSNQLRLRVSWAQAREAEERWFEEVYPWSKLPGMYRSNLGTKKLARYMSERLSKLIARNLPKLQEELYSVLDATEKELQSMPLPLSSDALSEMIKIVESFCQEVASHVKGKPMEEEGLVQLINHRTSEFKKAILSLAPKFKPYDRSESRIEFTQASPIELFDQEEEDVGHSKDSLTMHVDEVMSLIENSRTRELPGYYPYDVPKDLVKRSKLRWKAAAMAYFEDVHRITREHFRKLVDKRFKEFKTGKLNSLIELQIQDELNRLRQLTNERLQWLHDVDEGSPSTQNNKTFIENRSKFLAYYKSVRYSVTNPDIPMNPIQASRIPGIVSEALANLNKTSLGSAGIIGRDLAKLIPDDGQSPALEVMATVSAFYHLSSKRIIDDVPSVVDYDYVMGLERNVQKVLYASIFSDDGSARCKTLLEEAPEAVARRTYLRKKHDRLEAAKKELQEYWMN